MLEFGWKRDQSRYSGSVEKCLENSGKHVKLGIRSNFILGRHSPWFAFVARANLDVPSAAQATAVLRMMYRRMVA